jgi:hypothetical protein
MIRTAARAYSTRVEIQHLIEVLVVWPRALATLMEEENVWPRARFQQLLSHIWEPPILWQMMAGKHIAGDCLSKTMGIYAAKELVMAVQ